MQKNSIGYIVVFAGIVCVVCSALVSVTAVSLKPRQDANLLLDKQKKVLSVAGLIGEGSSPTAEEVETIFSENIDMQVIDVKNGTVAEGADIGNLLAYDQQAVSKTSDGGYDAPKNKAKVARIPNYVVMYTIKDGEGNPAQYVLPVESMGLWGTMYGFLALDTDGNTIKGLTFYKDKETPGLGAEINNPSWKAKWPGRLVYGESGSVDIKVIKGAAGSVEEAPYNVDGLSGATLTSNGVTNLFEFWMGEEVFGPLIANLTGEGSNA